MTETKPGFMAQVKSYPRTFWVANTMEIFERMAWYGYFALSSLYITGPVETGALGFTSEERGQLQAIVPFILYLLPVVTGALADRYGYKRMFIIAYIGMIISYFSLGQFKTFPTFLTAFLMVALSAAIFKPVVVGTVARVTNASNSSMGFGIFYMMVNVGGFVGPLIAGAIRGISWRYVFIACSLWATVNLLIVLLFYRDPSTEAMSAQRRTLKKVASDMVEVLGNMRFGITVFVVLIALMLANQEWESFRFWPHCTIFIAAWLVLNFLWDAVMPRGSGDPRSPVAQGRPFFLKRMHCSNWRFALFLLFMSGFWTSFNQIFLTMPEYIRDFTDTRPMVQAGRSLFGALGKEEWIDRLAAIEEPELLGKIDSLFRQGAGVDPMVPPEPEKELNQEQARKKLDEARIELKRLARDSRVSDPDRLAARQLSESLAAGIQADDARVRAALAEAKGLADRILLDRNTRSLRTDASLDDQKRGTIANLLPELNAPGAKKPLTMLDIVDGARSLLQYKVRLQPAELAELLSRVPEGPQEVDDEAIKVAIATINKRLESKGKLLFTEADEENLRVALRGLLSQYGVLVPQQAVVEAAVTLSTEKRKLEPVELALGVRDLAYRPTFWKRVDDGRQVNPEHIVNFDALAIVLLQVLVSYIMAKFHRFTTMIVGMVIAAIGIGLSAAAGGTMIGPVGGLLIIVVVGIVIFAIGEMMASPTSQEYVGRIAPSDKVALYMGYYFVAVALGNLFGGILSGQLYGKLARDMQRPDLMWLAFGGIMLMTAIVFVLYNRLALPKEASHTLTPGHA